MIQKNDDGVIVIVRTHHMDNTLTSLGMWKVGNMCEFTAWNETSIIRSPGQDHLQNTLNQTRQRNFVLYIWHINGVFVASESINLGGHRNSEGPFAIDVKGGENLGEGEWERTWMKDNMSEDEN